jgi:hypothetical protein
MRFLCNYITNIVQDMGKLEEIITFLAVDRMFAAAAITAHQTQLSNKVNAHFINQM